MTSTLTVPQKEIPVLLDCDVLVVGAGASGFAAAVSASRAGAEVVLAEKNHYPGGVATSGLMCSMSNYFLTRDGTQVTTGLPLELVDRLVREGGAKSGVPVNAVDVRKVQDELRRQDTLLEI